jgi:glycosyltransferase involved in cell wall biosynthesis
VSAETTLTPLVSVVIPTYKRAELVRKAILSVFSQDLNHNDYELIVVDSSPDDRVTQVVEELRAAAPCFLNLYRKEPEGPGPSRCLGSVHSRGRFIAFLDSDCQASPGWLRAGLAAFEEKVGFVQGKTLPDPSQPAGIFKYYLRVEQENFIYQAANIFYRRESFNPAAGFLRDLTPRSDWPTGGEDVELAWRVKRSGWQSRFSSEALVYHEVLPVSVWFWLFNKRLYRWPGMLRKFPELRGPLLFARYFHDKAQAGLTLALLGLALQTFTPLALALVLPYIALRVSEPTRALRGIRRVVRPLVYLPKDLVSFALLLAGSLRYGALLL